VEGLTCDTRCENAEGRCDARCNNTGFYEFSCRKSPAAEGGIATSRRSHRPAPRAPRRKSPAAEGGIATSSRKAPPMLLRIWSEKPCS